MNFSELNKDQKQLLILVVGGILTIFFVISNLIIGPAKDAAEAAQTTIDEIERDVTNGERILRRAVITARDVQTFSTEILTVHQDELPPRFSPYIWAVEKLSLLAEEVDIIISVREHSAARYTKIRPGMKVNPESIPFWIPYTVDVQVNTTFANLKKFLTLLHESFPYASIADLEIQANASRPEEHDITFLVEWPTFRFDNDLAWITEQADVQEVSQ